MMFSAAKGVLCLLFFAQVSASHIKDVCFDFPSWSDSQYYVCAEYDEYCGFDGLYDGLDPWTTATVRQDVRCSTTLWQFRMNRRDAQHKCQNEVRCLGLMWYNEDGDGRDGRSVDSGLYQGCGGTVAVGMVPRLRLDSNWDVIVKPVAAKDACCKCGGGSRGESPDPTTCVDDPEWYDKENFVCAVYYARNGEGRCNVADDYAEYHDYATGGVSGASACCRCGGGSHIDFEQLSGVCPTVTEYYNVNEYNVPIPWKKWCGDYKTKGSCQEEIMNIPDLNDYFGRKCDRWTTANVQKSVLCSKQLMFTYGSRIKSQQDCDANDDCKGLLWNKNDGDGRFVESGYFWGCESWSATEDSVWNIIEKPMV